MNLDDEDEMKGEEEEEEGQDKFDDNLDDDIEMKDDEKSNDNGEEEGQDKLMITDDDIEMKDDEKSMIMVKKKKMMMIINKIMKWIQPMKRNNYPKMKEEMLTMNSMVIMKSMKMSWNQIMKMMLLVKIMKPPTRK